MPRKPDATTKTVGDVRITHRKDRPGQYRVIWQEDKKSVERGAKSFDEAERLAIQVWLRLGQRGAPGAALNPSVRFRVVVEAWLNPRMHADWRSPSTSQKWRDIARYYVLPGLGEVPCDEMSVPVINDMLKGLADRGLAPATQTGALRLIKAAVMFGQENGVWDAWARPLKGVGLHRSAAVPAYVALIDRTDVPTRKQVEALARTLDDLKPRGGDCHLGLMARLAATSGVRQGELFALLPGDINVSGKRRTVTVARSILDVNGRLHINAPVKHEKPRVTVFGAAISDELTALVEARPDHERLFVPPRSLQGTWRKSSFGRLFRQARADTPDWPQHLPWHSLRHFFVCDMLDQGNKPANVSKVAGHATVRFTLDRYVGAGDDYLDDLM